MRPVAVLGATGAIGGRFVEVVAGEGRAPVRALVHRWWHTGRIARFPIELRSTPTLSPSASPEDLAAALDGCDLAISMVAGPELGPDAAPALVGGCAGAGIRRLVHVGCLDPRSREFEQALLDAGAEAGVEVVVVAATLVYGPFTQAGAHEPQRLVERGRVAIGAGSGPCHVIYVDDLIESVWAAAAWEGPLHGRVVATGPAPITWVEFYEAFGAIVGRPAHAVLPDAELASLAAAEPEVRAGLRWPPPPSRGPRIVRGARRRLGLPPGDAPQRRPLVIPDPEVVAARLAVVDPAREPSADIGWTPTVDFAEGMRRTAAYLRWSEPR